MDEKVLGREDEPRELAGVPPPAGRLWMPPLPSASARWRSAWLVSCGLLAILVLLTVNVLARGPLVGADERIRAAVQAQATSPAWRWLSDSRYGPAQLIVDLGGYQVAIPVLAVCALIAAARDRMLRPLLTAFAGVVLLLVTVTVGKIAIGRTGPGLTTVGSGGLGVFPSGHAATATVCLGLAVLLLPGLSARARRAAIAAVAGVCALVGAALVWCDYHWCTDVVAGWALAALIIQAAAGLSRRPLPRWGRGRG